MTTLTNSAEGGTNGTGATPANTGGASGNAADAITTSATCTVTFDNAHAAHGTLSYKMLYGGTAGNIAFDWSTSMGTQSQIWFRFYLFLTANPSINLRFWGCKAATACANLVINNAGKLVFFNAAGTTLITSTNAVPLNQWFRVEGFVIGSSTTGQVEFKLFTIPDGTVPLETKTSSATANTNTSPTTYIFGNEGVTDSSFTYWQDDLGLSSTGYLGPAFTVAPPQPSYLPPRRVLSRGTSRGQAGSATPGVAPTLGKANRQPPAGPRSRPPTRGRSTGQGGSPSPFGKTGRQPGYVPSRRIPSRGHSSGQPGSPTPFGTAPRQRGYTPPRRTPARASIQFTPVRTVLPAPATGIADDGDAPWHIRVRRRRT